MNKMILTTFAAFFSLATAAGSAGAAQPTAYMFTWKNLSPVTPPTVATTCSPLEIKILSNGSVVDQKYSTELLKPGTTYQMNLSASYCSKIQIKALCSGNNNFQEIGCTGGTIEISSPSGMTFYR